MVLCPCCPFCLCVAAYCMQCFTVRCSGSSVLQCVAVAAVCYSVLQCSSVRCNMMQCAAACCSVLQHAAVYCSVLQCVAVCCSMLQCFAVCCSVLQCATVFTNKYETLVTKYSSSKHHLKSQDRKMRAGGGSKSLTKRHRCFAAAHFCPLPSSITPHPVRTLLSLAP